VVVPARRGRLVLAALQDPGLDEGAEPGGQAVASIRSPVVSLRISASESVLSKLSTSDFRAEVDLSRISQSSADLVVIGRVVSNKNVQIIDITPSVVTVTLEAETSKVVPVVAARVGTPPQGYTVPQVEPQPPQVRVSGATSLIGLVEHADADVNLTGVRVGSTRQYALTARDARGADIRGVRIEPANADIRVSVVQQEVTQVIAVVVRAWLSGFRYGVAEVVAQADKTGVHLLLAEDHWNPHQPE